MDHSGKGSYKTKGSVLGKGQLFSMKRKNYKWCLSSTFTPCARQVDLHNSWIQAGGTILQITLLLILSNWYEYLSLWYKPQLFYIYGSHCINYWMITRWTLDHMTMRSFTAMSFEKYDAGKDRGGFGCGFLFPFLPSSLWDKGGLGWRRK